MNYELKNWKQVNQLKSNEDGSFSALIEMEIGVVGTPENKFIQRDRTLLKLPQDKTTPQLSAWIQIQCEKYVTETYPNI